MEYMWSTCGLHVLQTGKAIKLHLH
jgi:hypothetical protein